MPCDSNTLKAIDKHVEKKEIELPKLAELGTDENLKYTVGNENRFILAWCRSPECNEEPHYIEFRGR